MAKHNAFLAKQEEIRQASFAAGGETMAQQNWDIICLVLHEKFGFGAERLKKLLDAVKAFEDEHIDAWLNNPESDYQQEKIDAALRDIFGDKVIPFRERYPYLRECRYDKPHRKGGR